MKSNWLQKSRYFAAWLAALMVVLAAVVVIVRANAQSSGSSTPPPQSLGLAGGDPLSAEFIANDIKVILGKQLTNSGISITKIKCSNDISRKNRRATCDVSLKPPAGSGGETLKLPFPVKYKRFNDIDTFKWRPPADAPLLLLLFPYFYEMESKVYGDYSTPPNVNIVCEPSQYATPELFSRYGPKYTGQAGCRKLLGARLSRKVFDPKLASKGIFLFQNHLIKKYEISDDTGEAIITTRDGLVWSVIPGGPNGLLVTGLDVAK